MGSSRPQLTQEFEHGLGREARRGCEPPGPSEFAHCIGHGSPMLLECWHSHADELPLIVGANAHSLVADDAGHVVEPGHVVHRGPDLPHNWISTGWLPDRPGVRSSEIECREAPLLDGRLAIKELKATGPLLEREQHGIAFFGLSGSGSVRAAALHHHAKPWPGTLCRVRRLDIPTAALSRLPPPVAGSSHRPAPATQPYCGDGRSQGRYVRRPAGSVASECQPFPGAQRG